MQPKTSLNINFLEDLSAPSEILSKRSWLIVSLAGIAGFLMIIPFLAPSLLGQVFYTEAASRSMAFPEPAHLPINLTKVFVLDQISSGLPVRLKIPKIKVDAALEQAGLTPDGSVDLPKGRSNAAWFKLGPRPGDNGSAVIAGHYGYWKDGQESIFNDLNKLAKGDRLYVEDEKGATITFIVRASQRYDQNADAKDVFSSNDGQSHLILVTCEGVWNKVSQSYPERLVVFTDKEQT